MAHLIGMGVNANVHLTKTVKRDYSFAARCKYCQRFTSISDKTFGFICCKCGKYNNVEEAKQRLDVMLAYDVEYDIAAPHVRSESMDNYVKFRDEHQVRADLYVKGITREKLGFQKFNKILKQHLIQNHCYRGKDSHVD